MAQRDGSRVQIIDFYPARGMFRPGETIALELELAYTERDKVQGTAHLRLFHLGQLVAELEQPFAVKGGEGVKVTFTWTAPRARLQGYGADLTLCDDAGQLLATASTAFDVSEHWTLAPRYGFLCDFSPNRAGFEDTLRQMARYHINALQFYDWQYRHDHLLSTEDLFIDPLGRCLSLATTRALVEAAHRSGMAAMPYSAIYAASPPFFRAHPDWALFDADGNPYVFGDDFLYIMNPAPGCPWVEHLLRQFEIVLRAMNFDGIHLDQYGEPQAGFDAAGHPIELAQVLPALINRVKEVATAVKPDAAVVFNAVKSWPLKTVGRADQDFVYIEVWPPRTTYRDLREVVLEAKLLSGGKRVVVAAYVSPTDNLHGVLLVDAILFAHGAAHIELGEGNGMLADPYFPNYEVMSSQVAQAMRVYYDFAVRYENLLYEGVDNTPEMEDRFRLEGVPTGLENSLGKVWVVGQKKSGYQVIHLINLLGLPDGEWAHPKPAPTILRQLPAQYNTTAPVERICLASPDYNGGRWTEVPFEQKGSELRFVLPELHVWAMLILEGLQ
jgi:dextranase